MRKIAYFVVPVAGFAMAFAAFAQDVPRPGRGPAQALERALERLEKVENLEFDQDKFTAGAVPATLAVNPQGNIRITGGRVTAVADTELTVESWRLSFLVRQTAETKVFAGRAAELGFGDIAVGNTVDIFGRLDAGHSALIHAEVIHNRTRVIEERGREIDRLRSVLEDLIRRLQEILGREGRPLPPGIRVPTPLPVDPPLVPTPPPPQVDRNLPFSAIEQGVQPTAYSNERGRFVVAVRNSQSWDAFWTRLHAGTSPLPSLPSVDFGREMVIAAFMGLQNTGGHSIGITRVVERANVIEVYVSERSPRPDEIVTMALTLPRHIVRVAQIDKPVVIMVDTGVLTP